MTKFFPSSSWSNSGVFTPSKAAPQFYPSAALQALLLPADPKTVFIGNPNNAEFLSMTHHKLPDGATPLVHSTKGKPGDVSGRGQPAFNLDIQCPKQAENFFSCSSFFQDSDGVVRPSEPSFAAMHCVVLDDVTGVSMAETKLRIKPTWSLEFSPGRFQLGFVLAEPITDIGEARFMQRCADGSWTNEKPSKGIAFMARLPHSKCRNFDRHEIGSSSTFYCRPHLLYTQDQIHDGLDGIKVAIWPNYGPCPQLCRMRDGSDSLDKDCYTMERDYPN